MITDRVFDEDSTTNEVYDELLCPMIQKAMKGINGECVLFCCTVQLCALNADIVLYCEISASLEVRQVPVVNVTYTVSTKSNPKVFCYNYYSCSYISIKFGRQLHQSKLNSVR